MKKTKLLALASLLLVAGLVGCGGKTSSEAPKTEAPTSQTTEKPTSETPATSEKPSETPATSEKPSETPATSETPTTSQGGTVTYEATPALTGIPMDIAGNYTEGAEIKEDIVVGNFTLVYKTGKTGVQVNANSKKWDGVEYTHRLNVKSGDHTLQFNAAKAGKLVMIAMSSSKTVDKETTGDGKGNRELLLDGASYGLMPLSTDAVTTLVEIPFTSAGTHTFQAKGGAWYLWAAWVYYVA